MSQDEILEFLLKHKNKWFRTKTISLKIGLSPSSVGRGCKGLYRRGYIYRRDITGKVFEYQVKNNE